MAAASKSKGNHSAALLALHALRTSSAYREAEFIRRSKGAKAMVAKKDTKEYAAALLLIGTWNTIGAAVRQAVEASSTSAGTPGSVGDDYMDAIFESIPVCNMYRGLLEALEKLEQQWGEEYAPDFEWLYQEYLKWLEKNGKDEKYRTRHCNGIRAFFG